MLHCREKKASEFSALAIRQPVMFLLEKSREELLCEVVRIRRVHHSANIGVYGRPIDFAEFTKRVSGLRRRVFLCRQYNRPMRSSEPTARLPLSRISRKAHGTEWRITEN